MRNGNWKLHLSRKRQGVVELYDLIADPSESENIAGDHPEVVNRLSEQLRSWAAELPMEYIKLGK